MINKKITVGWFLSKININENTDIFLGNGFTLELLKFTNHKYYFAAQKIIKRIKENYLINNRKNFDINEIIKSYKQLYLETKNLFNKVFKYYTSLQINHYNQKILIEEQKIEKLYQDSNNLNSFENWFAYLDLALIMLNLLNPPEEVNNLQNQSQKINSTDKMIFYGILIEGNPKNSFKNISNHQKEQIQSLVSKIVAEKNKLKKVIINSLTLNYKLTNNDLKNIQYIKKILENCNNIFTLNYDQFVEQITNKEVHHFHGEIDDFESIKIGYKKPTIMNHINPFVHYNSSAKKLVLIGIDWKDNYDMEYIIDAMQQYDEIYLGQWENLPNFSVLNSNNNDLIISEFRQISFEVNSLFIDAIKSKIIARFDVKSLYND